MTTTYAPGELVDITIRGARVRGYHGVPNADGSPGDLMVTYGGEDGVADLTLALDVVGVTVERMASSQLDRLISIDAECNGLAGRAFAVGLTLSDRTGELEHVVLRCPIGEATEDPWVAKYVLPAIAEVPVNLAEYPYLLAEIGSTIQRWGGREVPLIAHVAWPVEARLLLDVYSGQRVWEGPYPLIDVASVLLAKGHNPLSVDDYLAEHGIPVPPGSPHHPLYDARAAERCLRHLLGPADTEGGAS